MSKLLSQTCRACLFPLNANTNVPIFEEYQSNSTLSFMISETIHILVSGFFFHSFSLSLSYSLSLLFGCYCPSCARSFV